MEDAPEHEGLTTVMQARKSIASALIVVFVGLSFFLAGCSSDSKAEIEAIRAYGELDSGRITEVKVPSGILKFRDEPVDSFPDEVRFSSDPESVVRLAWSLERYSPEVDALMHPDAADVTISIASGGSSAKLVKSADQSESLTTGMDSFYLGIPPGDSELELKVDFDGVVQTVSLGDPIDSNGSVMEQYSFAGGESAVSCALDDFGREGPTSSELDCSGQYLRLPYLAERGWAAPETEWVVADVELSVPLRLNSSTGGAPRFVPESVVVGVDSSAAPEDAEPIAVGDGRSDSVESVWRTSIGQSFSIPLEVELYAKVESDSPSGGAPEQLYRTTGEVVVK
ncbi:hypothetical protein [Nocardioides sp.]|uniref:hypothetical protein n=1 Tax=Nocardioides sp. TaxID=35761 RepID=UPI001983CEDC|nr:hypothetical protein [Nocardioides sp.]MBC7275628.1 hypothetical protein [Nocardioides sp.]